ncbi:hypothetical protein [Halorubrum yunnanense]|uniref:Uncharacterized protein n=1 Tax=Halorubrum yunnanense TaxID=1526162 RepID=A0ABD5YKN0_9EURY|nr:hypothetical protein [Halorubrum yunnanense]
MDRLCDRLARDVRGLIVPRECVEGIDEVIDSAIEHVQRMGVDEYGFLALYRVASVIDLEVALSELRVRLVLMPPYHEIPLSVDPLDPIEVVRVSLREIE